MDIFRDNAEIPAYTSSVRTADSAAEFQTAAQWQSWLSQGQTFPVFQPVLSLETQTVFGYECFGRIDLTENSASLGSFFRTSDQALLGLQQEVGLNLAQKVAQIIQPLNPARLIINELPSRLAGREAELPPLVQALQLAHIPLDRVILDILLEPGFQNLLNLKEVMEHCRSLGCQIALGNIGSESSQLDLIPYLKPDFIKISLTMFHRSFRDRNFRRTLEQLGRLAENSGTALLIEGIETAEELQQALQLGARYVQGYFFSAPVRQPAPMPDFQNKLREALENFRMIRTKRIQRQVAWENEMLLRLVDISFALYESDGLLRLNEADLKGLEGFIHRLYFCDLHGYQISGDYLLTESGCRVEYGDVGRNMSMRPYFFDHVYKLHGRPGGWSLSDVYLDETTHGLMRTFSRYVTPQAILYLDVLWANFADL